jgi:hypothetical protein
MKRYHTNDWLGHLKQVPTEDLPATAEKFRALAASFPGIRNLRFRWSLWTLARQVDKEFRRRMDESGRA